MKAAYDRCSNYRHYRAAELEEHVWQEVRGLLRDPERLRAGMDAVIETHRSALRGAPEWEEKAWLDKLAEVDSKRVRYQEMVAEELTPSTSCGRIWPAWLRSVPQPRRR